MANIGYATLTVVPSIQGVRRSLERQLDPHMKAAGQQVGKQLGQSISQEMGNPIEEAIAKSAADAAKAVEKASGQIAKARKSEQQSAIKVARAESALEKVRKRASATDADVRAAELTLKAARDEQAQSASSLEDAVHGLEKAQLDEAKASLEASRMRRQAAREQAQAVAASAQEHVQAHETIRHELQETADESDRTWSRISRRARGAAASISAGFSRLGGVFRSAAASIDQDSWRTRNTILLIGTAVNGLVSASLPVLATLGAGIAGLGSAGVAAGLGIAGVAAVAVPAISDIAEVLKLQEQAADGSEAAAEKLADRMSKLSPAARVLLKDWQALSEEFHDWSRQLQPAVLPVFSDAIGLLSGRFGALSPLVRDSAAAIRGLIKDADAAMASPFWDRFLGQVTRQAPTAITGLGRSGGNIAAGAAGVMSAFLPSTPAAVGWIEQITGHFREWGQGLGDSPGFRGFLDYVAQVAPTVEGFFASLGPAVANLAVGLAPLGETVLQLGTAFADMIASAPPEAITAIAAAIALIGATIKGAALVSAIAAIANPVGLTVAAVAALAAGLAVAWQRSERFRAVVGTALGAVQAKAAVVGDYFEANVWPILRGGWDVLRKAADRGATALTWAFEQLEFAGDGLRAYWGPLWGWAERTFGRAFGALADLAETGLDNVRDIIKIFDAALDGDWSEVWEGAKRILKRSVGTWAGILKDAAKTWLDGLQTGFRELPESLGNWVKNAAPEVADKLKTWTTEFVDWAKETGPEVLAELEEFGTELGNWLSTDLPPIINEGLAQAGDQMAAWARGLPGRIGRALSNTEQITKFVIQWGPKIAGALTLAAAAVVLAIPAIFAAIGFAIQVVIVSALTEMGKQAKKRLDATVRGWALSVRAGVTAMVTHISTLPARVAAWLIDMRNRAFAQINAWRVGMMIRARQLVGGFIDQIVRLATGVFNRLTGMKVDANKVATDLKNGIVGTVRGLRNNALRIIGNFRHGVVTSFRAAQAGAAAAWDKLRASTRRPVEYVVNTVYNRGIRGVWNKVAGLVKMPTLSPVKFKSGGIMPGYTPGRDPHKFYSPTGGALELSGGEAIMRPEVTRALGAGTVNSLNAAARTGGISGVRDALGFARGGIYGGAPTQAFADGGILGRLAGFAKDAKDQFASVSLRKAAGSVLGPLIGQLSGGSPWREGVAKIPGMLIRRFLGYLQKEIEPKLGGNGKKVVDVAKSQVGNRGGKYQAHGGIPGLAWCGAFVKWCFDRARAGKALRGVSNTNWVPSYAGALPRVSKDQARAGDLGLYRGDAGHINIYTGKKWVTVGGNESNAVRQQSGYFLSASSVRRPKWNAATGGILPKSFLRQDLANNTKSTTPALMQALRAANGIPSYDDGGVLKPGLQMVHNGTGRPEVVLTQDQWRALSQGGDGASSPLVGEYHQHLHNSEATFAGATEALLFKLRKSRRGGVYADRG